MADVAGTVKTAGGMKSDEENGRRKLVFVSKERCANSGVRLRAK